MLNELNVKKMMYIKEGCFRYLKILTFILKTPTQTIDKMAICHVTK